MDSFRYKIIREIQLKNNDFFVLIYGFIITHLDYTWEKREKLIRKEEYEDGKAAGRTEGISIGKSEGSRVKLISLIIKKIQRGKDILSIADAVEEPVEVIQPIYDAVLSAPGADADQIYDKVYLKLE